MINTGLSASPGPDPKLVPSTPGQQGSMPEQAAQGHASALEIVLTDGTPILKAPLRWL